MSSCQYFQIQTNAGLQSLWLKGREAWALRCLIAAGDKGCTPIDHPGPRWSAYVFTLREMGVQIETIHEKHGPPFPGHHARYVLRSVASAEQEAA